MPTEVSTTTEQASLATFQVYLEEYLRYLRVVRQLSKHSIRAYQSDLEGFCRWVERNNIDPLNITHRELRKFLMEQTQAQYAQKTINRRLSAVRSFYKWLVHEEKTSKDAAAALTSPKLSKLLPHTMTDAQAASLIEVCSTTDPQDIRDRALIEFLYASGARISEVAGLTLDDIDFSQGQVRLFGKGSKERIVPLYPVALETLRTYMVDARGVLISRGNYPNTRSLFISSRGNPMSAATLRVAFEKRVAQAGLDVSITPHAMRHTFATSMLSGGADLRSVQELLGHESLSTTQLYTHLSVDRLKEATRQAHPRSS